MTSSGQIAVDDIVYYEKEGKFLSAFLLPSSRVSLHLQWFIYPPMHGEVMWRDGTAILRCHPRPFVDVILQLGQHIPLSYLKTLGVSPAGELNPRLIAQIN